jgi:hypothetical protein
MMGDGGLASHDIDFVAFLLGASSVIGCLLLCSLLDYLAESWIAASSLLTAGSGINIPIHAHSFSTEFSWIALTAGITMLFLPAYRFSAQDALASAAIVNGRPQAASIQPKEVDLA